MADFKNPQQEPGSERRLLLVLAVTFLGFIVFQAVLKKYGPQPPAPQTQNQPAPVKTTVPEPLPAPSAPLAVTPNTVSKQASTETETVIENDLYKITFTNRGAQVKSWILKKFDNDAQNGLLDLVNPAAAQKFGYPLSLFPYDETLRNRLNSALYIPSETRPILMGEENAKVTVTSAQGDLAGQTLKAPASITFEYSDQDLVVHKTFRFDDAYVLNVETSVVYKGAELFAPPAWPSGFGDEVTPASYAAAAVDYHNDASTERSGYIFFPSYVSRLGVKSISGGNTIKGPIRVGRHRRSIFHRHLYPRRSHHDCHGHAPQRHGHSAEARPESPGRRFQRHRHR